MAQRIVVENDSHEFWERCRELFDGGWEVIPGTVAVAVSTSERNNDVKSHIAFFTDGKDEN